MYSSPNAANNEVIRREVLNSPTAKVNLGSHALLRWRARRLTPRQAAVNALSTAAQSLLRLEYCCKSLMAYVATPRHYFLRDRERAEKSRRGGD
jgi:hypothetical protein